VSRQRLELPGGRPIYIEPVAVVADARGDVLLAGERNYAFRPNAAGGWTSSENDSILGVVIHGSRPPQAVPSPIPTRQLIGVRAISRPRGGWHVVFGQARPYTGPSRPDTAQRLWYGIFDRNRWSQLEEIPLPSGSAVSTFGVSSLVQHGDTVSWALPIRTADQRRDVIVLSRTGGVWSHEIARTMTISYLDLAYQASSGLTLAIVQPDRRQRSDGNSLFLWSRRPTWQMDRKLVSGNEERVHRPQFGAAGAAVSWEGKRSDGGSGPLEASAILDPTDSIASTRVVLDASLGTKGLSAPLSLRPDSHLWVIEHQAASDSATSMRIVRVAAGRAELLGTFSTPFNASFGAVVTRDRHLLVTGARIDPGQQLVSSLLIRYRLKCPVRVRQ
jgi:hypothetical protein